MENQPPPSPLLSKEGELARKKINKMQLLNPTKISYKNLMSSKLRSFLTILGIIIGVASVIIIMAIGRSAQSLIISQITDIGSNLIAIIPGASEEDGPPAAAFGITTTTLTYDDLSYIRNKKNTLGIEDVAGYVSGTASVSNSGTGVDMNSSFSGVTASYINVENGELEKGRFFNEEEEKNLSRVVVLGNKIAKDLFEEDAPLNKKIKINDQNFKVIGVFEERGSGVFGAGGQDDTLFIPLKTSQKILLGINHLGFVRIKAEENANIELVKAELGSILRDRHDIDDPKDDDFSIRDQASALETIEKITNVLRYFLLVVGSISLLVGGVGIMNIMLITVSQRVKEIGLRKAVGAKRGDVLMQFLIESATISLIGGVIGIIFGLVVSFLAALAMQASGYDWQFLISPWSIVIAVLVSIAIGIIFGIYPARKASKISPMEALRYE